MLLPELYAIDVCCPRIGLCAFDVNQTRCAALLYVGLGVQSRNVLLPGLCSLHVCCPSLELCALNVNRTRYVSLLYVGLGVQSRIVLLQALCALDVCCPSPGLCACLLYTSPSPRDGATSRMPSSA